METHTSPIAERGVLTLPTEAWEKDRFRTEIIGPLASLEIVGHQAVDTAGLRLDPVCPAGYRAFDGSGARPIRRR